MWHLAASWTSVFYAAASAHIIDDRWTVAMEHTHATEHQTEQTRQSLEQNLTGHTCTQYFEAIARQCVLTCPDKKS